MTAKDSSETAAPAASKTSYTLFVGDSGTGTLNIQYGGQVQSYNGRIGRNPGTSSGTVLVDGNMSQWTNTDDLEVGVQAYGEMTISGGGLVEDTMGRLGVLAGSHGIVLVTGNGSKWDNRVYPRRRRYAPD